MSKNTSIWFPYITVPQPWEAWAWCWCHDHPGAFYEMYFIMNPDRYDHRGLGR